MLTIRLKRIGRTGHAQFRVVAQDKRTSPTSGRVIAYLGSYDPHTKQATVDSQKITDLMAAGAQPSPRVVKLLEKEGIKLPAWVEKPSSKQKAIRNPEKLRKNRPAEAEAKPEAEGAAASTEAAEPKAENDEPVIEETTPAEEAADKEPSEAETQAEEASDKNPEVPPENSSQSEENPPVEPAVEDQPKAEA